jgi:hypothetical protein
MQLPTDIRYATIEGGARFDGMRYAHVNNENVLADSSGHVVAIYNKQ